MANLLSNRFPLYWIVDRNKKETDFYIYKKIEDNATPVEPLGNVKKNEVWKPK